METRTSQHPTTPRPWVSEQIKHVWQDFRGDADTGIANADDSLIPRFAHSGGGAGSFTISTRKGPD